MEMLKMLGVFDKGPSPPNESHIYDTSFTEIEILSVLSKPSPLKD